MTSSYPQFLSSSIPQFLIPLVPSSGRSASRRAFRYIFARLNPISLPKTHSRIPSPKPVPDSLAKDAAPIPNATCKKKIRPFYSTAPVETSPLWRLKKCHPCGVSKKNKYESYKKMRRINVSLFFCRIH